MKNRLQKRLNNEKGLTLVELLAVIVILGIIAAIAVPSIGGIIENTRVKAVVADAQNFLSAADLYFVAENSAVDAEVKLLEAGTTTPTTFIPNYLDNKGSLLTVTVKKTANGNTIEFTGEAGVGGTTVSTTKALTKTELNTGLKAGTITKGD